MSSLYQGSDVDNDCKGCAFKKFEVGKKECLDCYYRPGRFAETLETQCECGVREELVVTNDDRLMCRDCWEELMEDPAHDEARLSIMKEVD